MNSIARKLGLAIAVAASMALASCGPPPGHQTPTAETDAAVTAQRVADVTAVNNALRSYHAANAAYPVSNGFQGYASNWGAALGERWIPELTELASMPRDPARAETGGEAQYLFFSDGVDYKLIAHNSGDCTPAVEAQGVRIDPRRRSETGCWAYGYWSPGGEAF